jgi:hypothetical protein
LRKTFIFLFLYIFWLQFVLFNIFRVVLKTYTLISCKVRFHNTNKLFRVSQICYKCLVGISLFHILLKHNGSNAYHMDFRFICIALYYLLYIQMQYICFYITALKNKHFILAFYSQYAEKVHYSTRTIYLAHLSFHLCMCYYNNS